MTQRIVFAGQENAPTVKESLPQRSGNRGNQREAAAFVNFYVPRPDGSRHSLGALYLYNDTAEGKQLIDYLNQGDAAVKAIFGDFLSIDYRLASGKEVGLALPGLPNAD